VKTLATMLTLALLAGCTPDQRKNCAVCRFVAGEWLCAPDANAKATSQPSAGTAYRLREEYHRPE